MAEDEFVRDLFEGLARYTTQAGYSLEPRVEPIMLMFLPELLHVLRGGDYLVVTPQFPIHNLANFRVGRAADALILR